MLKLRNVLHRFVPIQFAVVIFVLVSLWRVDWLRAETTNVKMSNGCYQPGAVLVYRDGTLKVATRAEVRRNSNAYVVIHGAHTDPNGDSCMKLLEAIRQNEPEAEVFFVDWSYWAKMNSDKLGEILKEQLDELAAEIFIAGVFDGIDRFLGGEGVSEEVFHKILDDNLEEFMNRIVANILPVEQAANVPTVAERAYDVLFTTDNWTFTTNGVEGQFEGLGLNPSKTHIIGHSHGAHVAGLVAKRVENKLNKRVKRVSALEPSTSEVHQVGENKGGKGWNRNVADFVEVYRTSEICCDDTLYGDLNLYIRSIDEHPLLNGLLDLVEDDDDLVVFLMTMVLPVEKELHSKVVDLFCNLFEYDEFREISSFSNAEDFFDDLDIAEGTWTVIDVE